MNTPEVQATGVCASCARPAREPVCAGCRARVAEQLAALPGWYGRLGEVLAPGAAPVAERVSSTVFGQLNLRLEPLNLRAWGGVPSILLGWENAWRADLQWQWAPFRGSAAQTVAGCAGFLAANWPWAAACSPDAGRFAHEVNRLAGECRIQVEGPGDARRIGWCPTVGEDGYACATALYAHPYVDVIECRGCAVRWERPQWIALATLMRAAQQDAKGAARRAA